MSRLALGTAQFGSHYGITNRAGQVSADEAGRMLALARESGIDCIDTARLYGESEAVIGSHRDMAGDFQIVTKTRTFAGIEEASAARLALTEGFATSLQALRRERVYGLLLHNARDLLGSLGPDLWAALEELKNNEAVEKIGVSVYGAEAIDAILTRYPIDIVQLPLNALDRRLVGHLEPLAEAGVEVHARSIFLQGLLLSEAEDIPAKFAALRPSVVQLDELFAGHGLSRLEGLLAAVLQRKEISRVVAGVTSTDELRAIVESSARAEAAAIIDEASLPNVDPRYLDPSRWSDLDA